MKIVELEHILSGHYHVGSKIGSGGFGKVYIGTHVITLHKVAIKVMEKRKLGDDLPRVAREIKALKVLNHQNIAQLFQIVETAEAFVLVLEYCRGGEVFDYIVNKAKIPEDEAREFFRQILSALCFIHERGFCHRDLKPENLLLGEKKEVKIIDFGLCAIPSSDGTGRDMRLETMCGSMAYAAPELLKGEKYVGREVDIWSLGVVLFTLVAGYLPFDGEDNGSLSRAIQSGVYVQPDHFSPEVKKLIQGMLQVNPQKRMKIEHLVHNPWVNQGYTQPVTSKSIYQMDSFDMDIVEDYAKFLKISPAALLDNLILWRYDHYTATYLIMVQRKLSAVPTRLTRIAIPGGMSFEAPEPLDWELPASCENVCNPSSSQLDNDWPPVPPRNDVRRPLAPVTLPENAPGLFFMENAPNLATSLDSGLQNISMEALATPRKARNKPPSTVLRTPSGPENTPTPTRPRTAKTPELVDEDSFKIPEFSGNLGASHGKRWVHSFERGLEKVKNIMTPRSKKREKFVKPEPSMAKTLHNVACGYQKDPDALFLSLKKAMEDMGMQIKVKGAYMLQGKQMQFGNEYLTFTLEVCQIPRMQGIVGIKRKRITGESWHYKKVVEQIMRNVQEIPAVQ